MLGGGLSTRLEVIYVCKDLTIYKARDIIPYMTIVTLTSKGQLTLPIEVRRALGLKDSDKLELSYSSESRKVTITKPMTVEELSAMTSRLPRRKIEPIRDVDSYYQAHRGDAS